MELHPELHWWRKCPVCGYSEMMLDSLSPKDKELAENNPYVKRSVLAAAVAVEQQQEDRHKKALDELAIFLRNKQNRQEPRD